MTVNQLIKHARLQAGLTQAEFAELTGMHQKAVSEYENGKVCPSADKLEQIFSALKAGFNFDSAGWEFVPNESYATVIRIKNNLSSDPKGAIEIARASGIKVSKMDEKVLVNPKSGDKSAKAKARFLRKIDRILNQ